MLTGQRAGVRAGALTLMSVGMGSSTGWLSPRAMMSFFVPSVDARYPTCGPGSGGGQRGGLEAPGKRGERKREER